MVARNKYKRHTQAMRKTFKCRLLPTAAQRTALLRALNHAYQRATNRRTDFAHQASRKLVNRFGLFVFEDLDIPAMQSSGNRVISRGIADVAWGQFVQFTTYKAASAGRAVLRVNPRGTSRHAPVVVRSSRKT